MKNRLVLGIALLAIIVLVTACGGSKSAESGTRTPVPTATSSRQVHVTITDNAISTSLKNFQASVPYFFQVTNNGKYDHNFIILQNPSSAEPSSPQGQAGVMYTAGNIAPGTTDTFTYQFTIASPQTQLQFASQLNGPGGHEIDVPVQVTRSGNTTP